MIIFHTFFSKNWTLACWQGPYVYSPNYLTLGARKGSSSDGLVIRPLLTLGGGAGHCAAGNLNRRCSGSTFKNLAGHTEGNLTGIWTDGFPGSTFKNKKCCRLTGPTFRSLRWPREGDLLGIWTSSLCRSVPGSVPACLLGWETEPRFRQNAKWKHA